MSLASALPAAQRSRIFAGPLVPRLIAAVVILGSWEGLVRAFAPDFVAKPSAIAEVLPRVISG